MLQYYYYHDADSDDHNDDDNDDYHDDVKRREKRWQRTTHKSLSGLSRIHVVFTVVPIALRIIIIVY